MNYKNSFTIIQKKKKKYIYIYIIIIIIKKINKYFLKSLFREIENK